MIVTDKLSSINTKYKLTILIYALFQKGRESDEVKKKKLEEDKPDFERIRCPKCSWQPSAKSLWYCSDCLEPEFYLEGCGTAWNTFNTRGKCPGCKHIWRWTSCLSCSLWSEHDDWYKTDR